MFSFGEQNLYHLFCVGWILRDQINMGPREDKYYQFWLHIFGEIYGTHQFPICDITIMLLDLKSNYIIRHQWTISFEL